MLDVQTQATGATPPAPQFIPLWFPFPLLLPFFPFPPLLPFPFPPLLPFSFPSPLPFSFPPPLLLSSPYSSSLPTMGPENIRMEQYLTHTDYALWEVIVNGDAPAVASASAEGHIPPKTAEQKLARKNKLKAKSTLLLAIPNKHLMFVGLGNNLFSVGQFCDSDLEVTFRRNTCFVRNLEGFELLKGNRTTNLYTINLHAKASTSPICLMAHATSTKSWLWHQRLSHLNFDTINDLAKNDLVIGLPKFKYHKEHLFPSCEKGKSKTASHPPKLVPNSKQRLHLLHMDLCRPMKIESINGKLALCYPKNNRGGIRKLGVKGDIGFFIGYSTNSCTYRVHKRRTRKIIETMNVQQDDQAQLQPEAVADNVPNAMFDGNTFINPFAPPSTSSAKSSSQYVDPSNMHTSYQPY
ncbi:integrase, catalytic region, zinc finger, CCHC-type containing protein [Tanacetum coccineum]